MNYDHLKKRTNVFVLDVLDVLQHVSPNRQAAVILNQVLRSATSVGANYRAACRARSLADFVSKIGIVEEEVDETEYWLQLLQDIGSLNQASAAPLIREAGELTAIFAASGKTARARLRDSRPRAS